VTLRDDLRCPIRWTRFHSHRTARPTTTTTHAIIAKIIRSPRYYHAAMVPHRQSDDVIRACL
jgi:hypothetical protein